VHLRSCFILRSLSLFFLLSAGNVRAQLCNGSLGDPVVNITFEQGTNATVPGYSYINSTCPNDGYYTIASSTANCFNNSWHTVSSDHTGGGGFLLVNASYTPGDFFVETVTDLCANTTYEFAAWMMNVLNRPGGGIKPNITFKIEAPDGTVLQQFETGDINGTATPEWKQYGFYFTTPATNAKIVLRMTNNAPGGIGNDVALDDITFRPCGAKITASIEGANDTVNVCESNTDTYTFNGDVSSAYQSPAYQWQLSADKGKTWKDIPGAISATYLRNPTGAGNYWYRLAVLEEKDRGVLGCRIASNLVIVNVHAQPIVNAGPDRVIIEGDSISLKASAEGDKLAFTWTPDDYMSNAAILDPTVTPKSDILYTLAATSEYGCSNEDEIFIKVVSDIFIPNAFTPNADGKNDTWKIPFLDPSFGAEVAVFNRYGYMVYHSKATVVSWDGTLKGKPQPTGTYVYMVTIKPGNFKRIGTVTLIR
jgi:gliding motility-associated-like protein